MSKNLLKIKKIINRYGDFSSASVFVSHFVEKKTRAVLFLFLVFRYRSYPYTNFGTQSVLIFIFVSVVVQSTA